MAEQPADRAPERPMSRIAVELMMSVAQGRDVVADVRVDSNWIVARRGPAPLDPSTFRFGDLYRDYFHQLSVDPSR